MDGGWKQDLWNWAMGQIGHSGWTLVDVVNAIWNAGASAIAAVKAGVTKFVEGVKAGMEYLAEAAINAILTSASFVANTFLKGMLAMMELFVPTLEFDLSNSVPLFTINGNSDKIGLEVIGTDLLIHFGGAGFRVSDILSGAEIETLGLFSDTSAKFGIISSIITEALLIFQPLLWRSILFSGDIASALFIQMASYLFLLNSGMITYYVGDGINDTTTKTEYFQLMTWYHFSAFFGALGSFTSRTIDFLPVPGAQPLLSNIGKSAIAFTTTLFSSFIFMLDTMLFGFDLDFGLTDFQIGAYNAAFSLVGVAQMESILHVPGEVDFGVGNLFDAKSVSNQLNTVSKYENKWNDNVKSKSFKFILLAFGLVNLMYHLAFASLYSSMLGSL